MVAKFFLEIWLWGLVLIWQSGKMGRPKGNHDHEHHQPRP